MLGRASHNRAMPSHVAPLHPLVWLPADALAFRCTVDEVGTLRKHPSVAPPEGAGDAQSQSQGVRLDVEAARRLAPHALLHLARLATGEGRSAVDACKELLLRAYGPAQASPSDETTSTPLDPWLARSRLSYHADNDEPK
jgi:hypothetical protein